MVSSRRQRVRPGRGIPQQLAKPVESKVEFKAEIQPKKEDPWKPAATATPKEVEPWEKPWLSDPCSGDELEELKAYVLREEKAAESMPEQMGHEGLCPGNAVGLCPEAAHLERRLRRH